MSQDLRSEAAAHFLQTIAAHQVLCDAITCLVSPDLYDAGWAACQAIKATGPLKGARKNVKYWCSVWSGFSLIVNRETPFHRDSGSAAPTYDLLISAGTHTSCTLDVAEVGARI